MLRIEEIVGAMDDDFRDALEALPDERLAELAGNKRKLDQYRPVGVSHTEAMAMIAFIQDRRANPPPPPEPEPEPVPVPVPEPVPVLEPEPEPEPTPPLPEPVSAQYDPSVGMVVAVMAGLDPAIHAEQDSSDQMDPRVKPEGDDPSMSHPDSSVAIPTAAAKPEPPARSLALPLTLAALIAAALLFSALL